MEVPYPLYNLIALVRTDFIDYLIFEFCTTYLTMQAFFSLENLINYLKSRTKIILFLIVLLTVCYSLFRVYTKLNKYESQVRFYITNSEAVDYRSIVSKGFIDISGEKRDLLRLQSFGYSNQLLQLVTDSVDAEEFPFLSGYLEENKVLNYIADLYEVSITDLGELEVTVTHENKEFSYFLAHQLMNGINRMNNSFLSEFKEDQIEASQRQLVLLNKEKKEILKKIEVLSKKNNAADLKAINEFKSSHIEKSELQDYLASINNPEKLELSLCLQKNLSIDENIESFNRTLYNDSWSLEMLKKKKPFITQDKPPKNRLGLVSILVLMFTTFLTVAFAVVLFYSLRFRYKRYIDLLFS